MSANTEQRLQRQVDELMVALIDSKARKEELEAKYNAAHAELVEIMHILHCVAEAPPPSMEQTVVVRGVCGLADRVRKADDRVRVLVDAIQNARKNMTLEQNFYSRPGRLLEHAINQIPQQTAEQIERDYMIVGEIVKDTSVLRPVYEDGKLVNPNEIPSKPQIYMQYRGDSLPIGTRLYVSTPLPKEQS